MARLIACLLVIGCTVSSEPEPGSGTAGGKADDPSLTAPDVLATQASRIENLRVTSTGLYWSRDAREPASALVHLAHGAAMPVTISAVPNARFTIVTTGDTIYAHGQYVSEDTTKGDLFVITPGQPIKHVHAWVKQFLVAATPTTAYFADGYGYPYNPYSQITARQIPPSCVPNQWCWIGAPTPFYEADEVWPASVNAATDGSTLYFVSQRYGNFPPTDIKRVGWRILGKDLDNASPASVLDETSIKGDIGKVVLDASSLYYTVPFDSYGARWIWRTDVENGESTIEYTPPGSVGTGTPQPQYLAAIDDELYWIDSHGQLVVQRPGDDKPTLLARDVNRYVENLAVDSGFVYFTSADGTRLLRLARR